MHAFHEPLHGISDGSCPDLSGGDYVKEWFRVWANAGDKAITLETMKCLACVVMTPHAIDTCYCCVANLMRHRL